MNIINPYEGVNFSLDKHIPAISHEHILSEGMLKSAYDRGIRVFAGVNYNPSAPLYPLSGFNIQYKDWESVENLTLIDRNWIGSIPSFTDKDGNIIDTDTLPQLANAEHISTMYWSDTDRQYPYMWNHRNVLGCLWAEVGNGDSIVNAEEGFTPGWRNQHPTCTLQEAYVEYLKPQNQQFEGKIFGTLNHNDRVDDLSKTLQLFPGVFKAMELFNQYYSFNYNRTFRSALDTLLNRGYKLFGTAVADWAGTWEAYGGLTDAERHQWENAFNNLTPEEKAVYGTAEGYYNATYVKSCDHARGCNVLLMPQSYDALPANNFNKEVGVYSKAEAAIDSYIAGRYYMSGLGTHKITQLKVAGDTVVFSVEDTPTQILTVYGDGRKVYSEQKDNTSNISVSIKDKMWVRFEVFYDDSEFIFTNPIWNLDFRFRDNIKEFLLLL